MQDVRPVRRALLSVSDKTQLIPFAKGLLEAGVELISTGGTFRALQEAGLNVQSVESVTGFPEIMNGRVKTLHPHIHGGILARRGQDDAVMAEHGITGIDLVVVNLYPFQKTIQNPGCTLAEAIEQIDVGGPTMVRAAAKNHQDVAIVIDPADYDSVLAAIESGGTSLAHRRQLAAKAFGHTANYDAAIVDYLEPLSDESADSPLTEQLRIALPKDLALRYGENPHQAAALYTDPHFPGWHQRVQHQGKPLSFNNIADANAAWECVLSLPKYPACVIVKHANPCGVALAENPKSAYDKAYACDPTSAFGGIIAFNVPVDASCVEHIIGQQFVEVVLAPVFSEDALRAFEKKPNVRVLTLPTTGEDAGVKRYQSVLGGLLVQTADVLPWDQLKLDVVTQAQPTAQQWEDAHFAWAICQHVKSNAIVFAKDAQAVGIGAGQMSRVFSVKIAEEKAASFQLSLQGSVLASDAFFPFPDSVDLAANAGAKMIIQPGGSKNDSQVIEAADALGLSMVFTGFRHFKH